ncbi:MAG TPA: efflux RND transporter periplasmic adaptor subunit [Verrucomicrobiae bacterium]|nr:efflux RND transporter periplasmic adaptor subunit [Verrucomicrobiae bacterium]
MNDTVMKPVPSTPRAISVSEAAASSGARLRNAGILALILVMIGAIVGLVPRWRQRTVLRAETQELAVPTVAVVYPAPGKAAAGLSLPAEVKPFLDAPIYARSSGYLTNWFVDIGGQVKEGDLLAEIDAPELRQELVRSKAELVQSEAALALAKITADRWTELLKTASVSEQEAAEKKADFELKSANVAAAHATVHRLEELQSFSHVRAPFSGTITARGIDIGQLIVAGSSKELFHLTQTSTLRVYVHVPQMAARAIAPGQTAELTVPEMPGRIFPARVVRTSGAMNAESRTLLVELQVDNSKNEILAGTYAQVQFTQANVDPGLTLPANTLVFRSEGTQVGVVGTDGKVELRHVALGRDFGSMIEIINGVGPQDRVILNPSDSLVSGTTVHVAKADSEGLTQK